MPDGPGKQERYASPYSTGGGGVTLERMLGALLLTRLLTGGAVTHLDGRSPATVALQQVPAALADDLVVTARAADGATILRLDIAVRRSPEFNISHTPTCDLVAMLIKADLASERSPDDNLEHRLCVAVSGRQKHAQQLAELASVARGKPDAEGFYGDIGTFGKYATGPRLTQLTNMIGKALGGLDDAAAGTKEYRTFRLLQRLRIWQVDLEEGHEDDWTGLVTDLLPVAIDQTQGQALALRNVLVQEAAALAIVSGKVTGQTLRRRLHGQLGLADHSRPPGWDLLMALDREARTAVTPALAAGTDDELRLPRVAAGRHLDAAIAAGPTSLLVVGDSGVGKSALVMAATTADSLATDTQALAVNLRHLPKTPAELLRLLESPVDVLLGELTAPERLLVIDATEAASEDHADTLRTLVTAAASEGTRIVAVTTTETAPAVKEIFRASGVNVSEHKVEGLDDVELDAVAEKYPNLERLASNARSRELLRRPIIVDLLRSAGDPGLPLTEAQALDQIWRQLVRNQERTQGGTPDARQEVMLRLAEYAICGGDESALIDKLDPEAVEGLRRSHVLSPASQWPWERVPGFRHDVLRAYAVARRLLVKADPAAALTELGAPRWTLPAARLACEVLLAAPDSAGLPLTGRFQQLQAGFDALADATGSHRWRDIPTEALLVTPDPGPVLKDAWPTLVDDEAAGVKRLLRVLKGRHRPDHLTDPVVAAPVIAQLIVAGIPGNVGDEAAEQISNWLQALVVRREPHGHVLRCTVRDWLLKQCAENQRELAAQDAERVAELAADPAEVPAADTASSKLFSVLGISSRRRRRRRGAAHRPYEWITDAGISHLSLLGPDLSDAGETILRQIADDDPSSLEHAVEMHGAGSALATYSVELLADLTLAYYRDEREDDDGGFGYFGGMIDDGIRHHHYSGGALSGFVQGPFLALFSADYRRGVKVLNRLLDHAAQARTQILRGFDEPGGEPEPSTVLSITGQEREYHGDAHVWLWYRGTGVGPHPCMSALQALEYVTDGYIRNGVPPDALVDIMLTDANNLAMPALALGTLIRHIEVAGDALAPFLAEPDVWRLEFQRTQSEYSGLAATLPVLANTERRRWTPREVSALLAVNAGGERADELRRVGEQLEAKAAAQLDGDTSQAAVEELAAVRQWASCLDRAKFKMTEQAEGLRLELKTDPAVEDVLGEGNAQRLRVHDAVGLTNRHAHLRDHGGRPADTDAAALKADVTLARILLEDPPEPRDLTIDGPVAAAASAVELHLSGRTAVDMEDLTWSASVLLDVAAEFAERADLHFDDSFFEQAADRSAARALPYLLLPNASSLRSELGINGADELDAVVALLHVVGVTGSKEARLAFARSLDAVWNAPCAPEHLLGRCHHAIAFELVTASYLPARLGEWDVQAQRFPIVNLDPPDADGLAATPGDKLLVDRLTPALRSLAVAAVSGACCADEARATLDALLAAHRRGMLAHDGYHRSDGDALAAARAALQQASGGRDDVLLEHVSALLDSAKVLAEALRALRVAADENADFGTQALRLWPAVMDLVIDAAIRTSLFSERTWGDYADAEVLPAPASAWGYQTSELSGDPVQWRDLMSVRTQMDRWVTVTSAGRTALVWLVAAVEELGIEAQLEHGLRWLEQAAERAGDRCASTMAVPEWLRKRRGDLRTADQAARWQRIVDRLVEAGDPTVADLAD